MCIASSSVGFWVYDISRNNGVVSVTAAMIHFVRSWITPRLRSPQLDHSAPEQRILVWNEDVLPPTTISDDCFVDQESRRTDMRSYPFASNGGFLCDVRACRLLGLSCVSSNCPPETETTKFLFAVWHHGRARWLKNSTCCTVRDN